MSEQQEENTGIYRLARYLLEEANNEMSEDDSEKLEHLQQELKNHTAAFNPEDASESEKTNFRRIRNAIYSRIKYRRRNRLMKKLSAEKADLELRNRSIRSLNETLEKYIQVAKFIVEQHEASQLINQSCAHATLKVNPQDARQPIDSILAAFEQLGQANNISTWVSELLSANQTLRQQQNQDSRHTDLALLSLLNQTLGGQPTHAQSVTTSYDEAPRISADLKLFHKINHTAHKIPLLHGS